MFFDTRHAAWNLGVHVSLNSQLPYFHQSLLLHACYTRVYATNSPWPRWPVFNLCLPEPEPATWGLHSCSVEFLSIPFLMHLNKSRLPADLEASFMRHSPANLGVASAAFAIGRLASESSFWLPGQTLLLLRG